MRNMTHGGVFNTFVPFSVVSVLGRCVCASVQRRLCVRASMNELARDGGYCLHIIRGKVDASRR